MTARSENLAVLRMAYLDTPLCDSIKDKFANKIQFKEVNFSHARQFQTCHDSHSTKVLNRLLETLATQVKLEVYLLPVFDNTGSNKWSYWQEALKWIDAHQIELVMSSSGIGFKNEMKNLCHLPQGPIYVFSSGRKEGKLDKAKSLFPQMCVNNINVFLVGVEFTIAPGKKMVDPQSFYPDKIKLFDEQSSDSQDGSSMALANVVGKVLNKCYADQKLNRSNAFCF